MKLKTLMRMNLTFGKIIHMVVHTIVIFMQLTPWVGHPCWLVILYMHMI